MVNAERHAESIRSALRRGPLPGQFRASAPVDVQAALVKAHATGAPLIFGHVDGGRCVVGRVAELDDRRFVVASSGQLTRSGPTVSFAVTVDHERHLMQARLRSTDGPRHELTHPRRALRGDRRLHPRFPLAADARIVVEGVRCPLLDVSTYGAGFLAPAGAALRVGDVVNARCGPVQENLQIRNLRGTPDGVWVGARIQSPPSVSSR